MTVLIQQSTTGTPLLFFMVQSADHITALTGASPTVTISKNGGGFGSPSGAVSEIANGWYQVAGNATDTGTIGPIALHATAASGDPSDTIVAQVVGFDPTVANLAANVKQWNGSNVATPNVAGVPKVDVIDWLGQAVTATANVPDINVKTVTSGIVANDVWDQSGGIEVGVTPRQALRYTAASGVGVLAGAATTNITIAAIGNAGTNRISATVDANGNRSSITLA